MTAWRKSTYSGPNGGECVEVGDADSTVLVRDTKNRNGITLDVDQPQWRRFITALKTDA